MFSRLRNRLVMMVMVITTVILVVAFSAIYAVASSLESQNYVMPDFGSESVQDKIEGFIDERLNNERSSQLSSLLRTLIISGIFIEIAVFCMALFIAEESIRPVKETYNAQKDFIANASHEIKTPLAAIQANLEAADIENNHWIDNVELKVEELTELNNQLLTLARAGSIDEAEVLKTVDLGELIQNLVKPLEPQIQTKKIKLKINNTSQNLIVKKINEPALRQILNILLDNAIKYANKKVEIVCSREAITVKNDGAKISAEQLPHIFERFYQADKTKNGVGLGLAIAAQVANQNRWKLSAKSDKLTEFTLKF